MGDRGQQRSLDLFAQTNEVEETGIVSLGGVVDVVNVVIEEIEVVVAAVNVVIDEIEVVVVLGTTRNADVRTHTHTHTQPTTMRGGK